MAEENITEKKKLFIDEEEESQESEEQEEALSLSDLPISSDFDDKKKKQSCISSSSHQQNSNNKEGEDHDHDLVFSVSELDMCAADEVFFQGQLLPFRPSVSFSDSAGPTINNLRRHSSVSSFGFRSSSKGSSSGTISRSQSSGSSENKHHLRSSSFSAGNSFYYFSHYPSPGPQLRRNSKHGSSSSSTTVRRRRSTSSSSPPRWTLFRLGVAATPDIELCDLRARRIPAATKPEKKEHKNKEKTHNNSAPSTFFGLSCKCSPESVDAKLPCKINATGDRSQKRSQKKDVNKKNNKKSSDLEIRRISSNVSMKQTRIFEWLEDLAITKS